jgi:hypothetical protein
MERETSQDLTEVLAALRALQRNASGSPTDPDPHAEAVKRLPGKGELVKTAPAIAMICGTTIFLAIIAVFVTLTVVGKPTDELFRLMNLFLNATGAIGVLFTLGVAINHARRTMENRQIALRNHDEAHSAAVEARTAASDARATRSAVNGDLERRMIRVLGPLVQRAAEEAVRLRCEAEHPRKEPEGK